MDIVTTYLESGKLEALCLGLLTEDEAKEILLTAVSHPAIGRRIREIETSLQEACYMQPKENTKADIMQLVNNISNEAVIDLQDLPLISRHSDATQWSKAVKNLEPLHNEGAIQLHPVKATASIEMYVAWVNDFLEEEGHDVSDFEESFLILEGSCECNLGGKMFYLQAGDFLTIPPKTKHSIKATAEGNGHVKAILQRRKIA
jgi:mannose-6-phosphate isomerase-like protein (cupin superfamily)